MVGIYAGRFQSLATKRFIGSFPSFGLVFDLIPQHIRFYNQTLVRHLRRLRLQWNMVIVLTNHHRNGKNQTKPTPGLCFLRPLGDDDFLSAQSQRCTAFWRLTLMTLKLRCTSSITSDSSKAPSIISAMPSHFLHVLSSSLRSNISSTCSNSGCSVRRPPVSSFRGPIFLGRR